MKIDYAKYTFVTPEPKKTKNWLSLILVCLLSGALIAGTIYWMGSHKEFHKKPELKKKSINTVSPQEVHFNFYSELPAMTMTAAPSSISEPPVAQNKKYIIQLGLFKDLNSASQHRISFLLAGCESQIVQVISHNEKTYRVQQGPFNTMSDAKASQKKLEKKGLETSIELE